MTDMVGQPKSLDYYPEGLIENLGKYNDYKLAEMFNTTQRVVNRLRNRLGIPSYISTRTGQYTCPICNKKFKRWKSQLERSDRSGILFCSPECQYKSMKTGMMYNCDHCGKKIYITKNARGEHHFCSKDCQYKFMKGENHPRYTGGYSSDYGHGWKRQRQLVLERDLICKRCGTSDKLEVHHIIPFQLSKDNSLGNLITLCKSCHSRIGNTYWKIENRPKYFESINKMRLQ